MPEDEEQHIIDYIIGNTEKKKVKAGQERIKKSSAYEHRKIRMDDAIYYCIICRHTWSFVPKFIDHSCWRSYPLNHIPTIGKKRNQCPTCRKKI